MDVSKLVQQNIDMDMTPMIDCVFLLMIFFVLVIDLSQKNLEDLILPRAQYSLPDDKPPKDRPVINVLQDGSVWYNGKVAFDPAQHGKDYTKIHDLLLGIRTNGITNKTLHLKPEQIGSRTVELIDDAILLRADKWTDWFFIGEIMKQCSNPKIGFWKVELALSEVDKETGEKNAKRAPQ